MTALTNPFVWVGMLSVLSGLCIAGIAWRQRDSRGARTYAVLMVVLAVWAGMYVVQLLETSAADKRQWLVARHALTSVIGTLFWLFAARYTDRTELLSARYLIPILAVGGILSLLAIVNPAQLYWTEAVLYTEGSIPRLDIGFGPAFWLMTLFVFVVVGGGHVYLVLTLLDSFSVYRRQLTAMAIVGIIEFTLMGIFLTEHVGFVPGVNPWPHVQLITYNMVFVAAPLGWSYLRQSLFDLQVLDRQAVIENMEDAVFVFDTDDVLRRVNDHGRRLLETDDPLAGQSASALFAQRQVLLDAYLSVAHSPPATDSDQRSDHQLEQGVVEQSTQPAGIAIGDGEGTNESVEITVDGDRRWYDVRASPIRNSADEQTGTVLVARDVTAERRRRKMLTERTEELKRKTKTLERQNERLDQFAGVVSHDLRNPLNVAQLRLELMREDAPEEHAEVVERNLDRMESMIEELLTMARAQTTVEETETVYLASLVEDAWETVPAEHATLDIRFDRDRTVEGDRELLLNVFENLFRNAVEHGSTSPDSQARQDAGDHGGPESSSEVTGTQLAVRVGPLTDGLFDGFYVEDTGKGIAELDTEKLFEFGQTTSEEGNGFGLAIVRELVRAHDWEISATNASHGGARFEIRTEPGG